MKYKIDVVRIRENSITLNGWAIGKSPDSKATFRVEDEKRQPVKFKHVNTRRDDVSQIYFKKVYDREFGFDIQFPYEQPRRRAGKTHNNFYRLYDAAMLSVTSYTKAGLRLATIFGSICAVVSMLIAMVYLVMKLIWWDRFPAGMAPMLIGMLFLGSVQLFFIGFLGEYIMSINQRVMKRPLVIEEERINFNEEEKKGGNEA